MTENDAAHAALETRARDADARVQAAAVELRDALTEAEAIARLTACSDGLPIGVFIPPVGRGGDATFVIRPSDVAAAVSRIAEPAGSSATVLPFARA